MLVLDSSDPSIPLDFIPRSNMGEKYYVNNQDFALRYHQLIGCYDSYAILQLKW